MRRTILTVLGVALAVRVVVAVTSFVLNEPYLFPDEDQYLSIARYVAAGRSPDEWFPSYGQELYDDTRLFLMPLAGLVEVFGGSRIVGQLLNAVLGAATAGLTTALAGHLVRPRFALAAGLCVAVMPSQVLFSAVVLREAPIWLVLVAAGVGARRLADRRPASMLQGLAICGLALVGLAFLREQTMVGACWALLLAAAAMGWHHWLPRVVAVTLIVALVPLITHSGVAGISLARTAAPHLDTLRQDLARGANSAFDDPGEEAPPAPPATAPGVGDGAGADVIARRAERGGGRGLLASLAHLPAGLVDVGLRPLPWERTTSTALLLAKGEAPLWLLIYAMSAVGLVVALRHPPLREAMVFPVALAAVLLGIAALTQGNLGTAFRHREQLLWALTVMGAVGLQHVVDARTGRAGAGTLDR